MKQRMAAGAVCCLLLTALFGHAGAAMKTETFSLSGTGSFMDSPPYFSGTIVSGTLSPGTFWFSIDDTGWPSDDPMTPNNERWDYIFATYFQYDPTPGAEGWDGRFPSSTLGEPAPEWRFDAGSENVCGGLTTSFTITIPDINANGILEDNEYVNKVFSIGIYCYINFGTGEFQSFCGQGNCSGTLDLVDEETGLEAFYVPSEASPSGRLYLKDTNCHTGNEESSWGSIKRIHTR